MDLDEYLSHNEEPYAFPSDPYWPPFEALPEIGPQIDLGPMGVDHQSPRTLSSGNYSFDSWPPAYVASPPLFDLEFPGWTKPSFSSHEPATLPLTVNLSQLLAPPGDVDQHECITPSPPSHALSSSCSPVSSSTDCSSDDEYHDSASGISPTKPRYVRHTYSSQEAARHSGPGVVGELDGHPFLRYPDGSYRCMSIVTASGQVSQYTQKSERPPDVGQPCGQTFRGRDETVRHLKTTQWHRNLDGKGEPLACDVCGRQLSRRDAVARHMKTLHPRQKEKAAKSTTAHSKRRTSNNKPAKKTPKKRSWL